MLSTARTHTDSPKGKWATRSTNTSRRSKDQFNNGFDTLKIAIQPRPAKTSRKELRPESTLPNRACLRHVSSRAFNVPHFTLVKQSKSGVQGSLISVSALQYSKHRRGIARRMTRNISCIYQRYTAEFNRTWRWMLNVSAPPTTRPSYKFRSLAADILLVLYTYFT